jgi:hypothetical protein
VRIWLEFERLGVRLKEFSALGRKEETSFEPTDVARIEAIAPTELS